VGPGLVVVEPVVLPFHPLRHLSRGVEVHRGTSLIRIIPLLGAIYLGTYGGPWGVGVFLMSEVTL